MDRESSDIFHVVNKVLSGNLGFASVNPDTPVLNALRALGDASLTELPVVVGKKVLGVFSLRVLANRLPGFSLQKLTLADLTVDHFTEPGSFVEDDNSIEDLLGHLNRHHLAMVGSPSHLVGCIRDKELLTYLHLIARPFVLLQEIELSLRALISAAVSLEELAACADRSLQYYSKQGHRRIPHTLGEMTFNDYITLTTSSLNWQMFAPVLGKNSYVVRSRLERIRDLRNSVFHFRKEMSTQDFETLTAERQWLHIRYGSLGAAEQGP
jgi:predicted transcriptional regulator